MVALADTSAWIEFLRKTGSDANLQLRELLAKQDAAITDAVLMEVLAGARGARDRDRLRRLLYGCRFIHTTGPSDFETAAHIARACRQRGETVRNLVDCLIAAVAIRATVPVLHADADFEVIARHTPLDIASR